MQRSAVRVRHPASGLIVIAEESRSQHENRERGLRRLRQALYLKIRDELTAAYNREGAAMTRRENVHRMADANKAFAHFAW